MGRPSKFKDEFIVQARKLCKLGATDMEVADFFGVDVRTLYRWKGEQPKFCQALKAGKDEADDRVERSLYARAIGYEHDDIDIRVVDGKIVQTKLRKYYPPDTTAGIFWVKNRRPDLWREAKAVELTGKDGGPVQYAKVERTIVDPAASES
ncbi:hypothetical protein ABIC33_001274 [Variovorax sp. 1140]|uniref:terminase n=1 Tax=Variovorax atrisoli TaxID=3394203 RepID=UPI0033925BDE